MFAVDFVPGHNDKSGRISGIGINIFRQDFQVEYLGSIRAGNSSLGRILFFCHLFGSHGGVSIFMNMPVAVTVQKISALHKRLRMRINLFNL